MTIPKLTLDNPLYALGVFMGGYPTGLPRNTGPQSKDYVPKIALGRPADRSKAAYEKRMAARAEGFAKWRAAIRQWNADYYAAYERFGAALSIAREAEPKFMGDQIENWRWDDDAVAAGEKAMRAGRVKFTKTEIKMIEEHARADIAARSR